MGAESVNNFLAPRVPDEILRAIPDRVVLPPQKQYDVPEMLGLPESALLN